MEAAVQDHRVRRLGSIASADMPSSCFVEQPLLAHGIEPKAGYHPAPADMIPMRMLAHHERIIRIIMGIINHAPELPLMR